MPKSLSRLFFASLTWFLSAYTLTAQDLPDVAQGLQPYVAYHGGQMDQVSMVNGGLTIRIPLVSYPQLGSLALSYSVIFNSFAFQDMETCNTSPSGPTPIRSGCNGQVQTVQTGIPGVFPLGPRLIADQPLRAGGTSVAEGSDPQAPRSAAFFVIASDNSEHALGPQGSVYRSLDDAGYAFAPDGPPSTANGNVGAPANRFGGDPSWQMTNASGTITDAHGIRYTGSGITDPDGNSIAISSFPSPSGYQSFGLPATDSVGRSIPDFVATSTSRCPTLPNAQFQPVTSALSWTPPGNGLEGKVEYVFCYATVHIYTHIYVSHNGPSEESLQVNSEQSMLQSILLPNGTHWGFVYDSNDPSSTWTASPSVANGSGQLTSLIFPTGGSINYTYAYYGGFCASNRITGANPGGVTILQYAPTVTGRTMADRQGNVLGTWQYNVAPDSGQLTTTVVTPENELTIHKLTKDPDTPSCAYFDGGHEVHQGPSSSDPILESTSTSYNFVGVLAGTAASAVRKTGETTVLNGQYSSSTSYDYLQSQPLTFGSLQCDFQGNNCQVTGSFLNPEGGPTGVTYADYDGSILRKESTAYEWQANAAYLQANLIDIPSITSVSDAAGDPLSQTTFTYDEPAYAPGGVRGHPTTASRMLNTSGPAPITHTGWNANGMKSFLIDADANAGIPGHTNPHGYTIEYSYRQCNGSVVTDTYNALNQHTSGTYFCPTGELNSFNDLNSQPTSFVWDSMGRLTSVTYPPVPAGTPTTTFSYDDVSNTVTKTVSASPDPDESTQVTFDGFGREIRRATLSDSDCQSVVDTGYDGDGRVSSVSNPYCTPSDKTYGQTISSFDALNRKLTQLQPGGGSLTWMYTGPTTDSWDEAKVHDQRTTDALGRLTRVMELGTSAQPVSLETDYTYNGRGDLLRANQIGQPGTTPVGFTAPETSKVRSFLYDSLSRLITSSNPETSTICYGQWNGSSCQGGYDPNGNLLFRTDANLTVAQYQYDGLNRVTWKRYSDNSLPQAYGYDGLGEDGKPIAQLAGPYAIGHLSHSSNEVNSASTYQYDALGRLIAKEDCNPHDCGYNDLQALSYDLAGHIIRIQYPDTRVVQQTFNGSGWLTSVTDTTSGGPVVPYWTANSYWANGAVHTSTLANGVTLDTELNARFQTVGTTANSPALAAIGGHPNNVYDKTIQYVSPNNGNIQSVVDNLNPTQTQNFTYDPLNRLWKAMRTDGAYNHVYNYDSFGNMLLQDNVQANLSYCINEATNRLFLNASDAQCSQNSALQYDAAGHVTADPWRSYTYSPEDELLSIHGASTATYVYNEGLRTAKMISSGWTDYVYLNGQVLTEQYSDGTQTDYIYANGQKIAKATDTAWFPASTDLYVNDQLGTTQVEMSGTGAILYQGAFTPFGQEIIDGKTSDTLVPSPDRFSTHYKFTGKERDAESGLDYFGARYYSSVIGRFSSPDWSSAPVPVPFATLSNPQTLNLYSYVGNNPLSVTDPFGHNWFTDFLNGVANATYRPLVTAAEHPVITGRAVGNAVAHPIATAQALKNGVVTTSQQVMTGNGTAIGTALGTAGMIFVPGVGEVGEAAEGVADVAKVGEVADAADAGASAAGASAPVNTAGYGNVGGGSTSAQNALTQANNYLGPGAKEIAPGVFRSADGTRQFRMTTGDITGAHGDIGPHVHFESIGSDGRTITENSHVGIH